MVTLTSNVTFSSERSTFICSSKPIQFTCEGTRLTYLAWKRNSVIIEDYTLSTNILEELPNTKTPGIRIELIRYNPYPSINSADFMSTLTAESNVLMNGEVIVCAGSARASESITIHYDRIIGMSR